MPLSRNASSLHRARKRARSWWKVERYAPSVATQKCPPTPSFTTVATTPCCPDSSTHMSTSTSQAAPSGRGSHRHSRGCGRRLHHAGRYAVELSARDHHRRCPRRRNAKPHKGECFVDWAAWGGAVADNQPTFCHWPRRCSRVQMFSHLPRLRRLHHDRPTAVGGRSPFHRGIRPPSSRSCGARRADRCGDRVISQRRLATIPTYLASRPDEAELQAIRLMIRLCRQYSFRLHIVHLSTALALSETKSCTPRRPSDHRRDLPSLSALRRRGDPQTAQLYSSAHHQSAAKKISEASGAACTRASST